jgi:hypothetical protein
VKKLLASNSGQRNQTVKAGPNVALNGNAEVNRRIGANGTTNGRAADAMSRVVNQTATSQNMNPHANSREAAEALVGSSSRLPSSLCGFKMRLGLLLAARSV